MVLKEISDAITKANVTTFAAVLALFIYAVLTMVWLAQALQSSNPLDAMKDVVLWSGSILLNILATYGIVTAKKS